MSMPSPKVIALNGGVLLIIGLGAVSAVKSFFKPAVEVCTARYARTVKMNVERNGGLMTPSDVQASVAGRDFGVMENVRIAKFDGAPSPAGFTVDIKAGTSQADAERDAPGGMSFPWQPRTLPAGVKAGCLSYSVFLPVDFNFGDAGTLPGLFGVSPAQGVAKDERFSTHVVWGGRGVFANHASLSTKDGWLTDVSNVDQLAPLSRGRWVRIDQEVVLNTPGKDDGAVRLWVDGSLRTQLPKSVLRYSADTAIQGVMADVYFGGQIYDGRLTEGKAVKDEHVKLTPFELRWN
jgi:hypothetical protein